MHCSLYEIVECITKSLKYQKTIMQKLEIFPATLSLKMLYI